jgi:D-alanine transaminase
MNNIHEKDWADDSWSGHSGMENNPDYCFHEHSHEEEKEHIGKQRIMSRIVYVNGEFVSENEAKISIFDRGFLFADGVYEVSAIIGGRLIDNDYHLTRLRRSLKELGIDPPMDDTEIETIQKKLITINQIEEGIIYLQITRGAADRDFAYPKNSQPSVILFTQKKNIIDNPVAELGLKIKTVEDARWARRDIKTISLLAASMAKMAAIHDGFDDAWLVDGTGNVTEGSSFNTYIVADDNTIITRHLSNDILHGITRRAILDLAESSNMQILERPFSVDEAYAAKEAFITSASALVLPVTQIDTAIIGGGVPGEITKSLRKLYIDMALT